MNNVGKPLSLEQFVEHYALQKKTNSKSKYCFILGAGASRASGIPTGSELAMQWLNEIKVIYKDTFDDWKKEINLEEEKEAEKYSEIYDKRFKLDYRDGYNFLEEIMEKSSPSFGYSVLAQILDKTSDNIVITTNFDHLIEDAMAMFAHKRPLVIGHESLAKYFDIFTNKPIIAKIHRDLFFAPKSAKDETKTLEEGWKDNLSEILKHHTPIVIGYGGNDGSLMGFLEKLTAHHGMYWCYYDGAEVNENIKQLVGKFNGHLIPIKGFDEMMLRLSNALDYKLLGDEILDIANQRAEKYKQEYKSAVERLAKTAIDTKDRKMGDMLSQATSTKEKRDWWEIQLEIYKEEDVSKKEEMYLQGVEETESPELMGNYANFLNDIKKDYDEAEKYYKKALEIDPNHPYNLGNYANFLNNIKKDYDEAEKYYKKALEINPNDADYMGNYALLLGNIRENYDEAEKYYKKALEIDPNHPNNLGNYANFLKDIKKDYDEAAKYYKKALEINPNHSNHLGNYALFLEYIRKDYDEAEKYYKKVLKIDPDDADFLEYYAVFLWKIKNKYDETEKYYKRALAIDQNNAIRLGNYAEFLWEIKKDYDEAEKYYRKSFEIDPNDADTIKNYETFLNERSKIISQK